MRNAILLDVFGGCGICYDVWIVFSSTIAICFIVKVNSSARPPLKFGILNRRGYKFSTKTPALTKYFQIFSEFKPYTQISL